MGVVGAHSQPRAEASEHERGRLLEEQAALRRVATLVARGAAPDHVFAAVAREVGQLLGVDATHMGRYEQDGTVMGVANWSRAGDTFPVGTRTHVEGDTVTASVMRTGRPARVDSYEGASGPIAATVRKLGIRSSVGVPITVEGRPWGVIVVSSMGDEPLAIETEASTAAFTELAATAISNTEARAEVERLAEEQAALRRVAMLVAEGASPTAVFDAVAAEIEGLLDADGVALGRYEPGDEVTLVNRWSGAQAVPPGTRLRYEGENVTAMVRRTERPARMEYPEHAHGPLAEMARARGTRMAIGTPIMVEGGLWGVVIASWRGEESRPADTEERMARFAELLGTAIANADSRDQLTASRARLVTAGDEARRRVVRDLHDGAQQRLVHAIVTLKLVQRALQEKDGQSELLIAEALGHAERANAELRELAHGILPSVLTRGGLRAGIATVVERLDVPVEVDVPDDRFPAEIEASAYFIVAEALTNVMKHSQARRAEVRASVEDGMLQVEVRDDGIGGADPDGHGLVGIGDRATALGGRLGIESPPGGGTLVAAMLPLSGS